MTTRRSVRVFGVVTILLGAALGGAMLFRCALAERLIEHVLAGYGFADARASVAAFTFRGITVAGLDAGSALHVEHIEAVFDFTKLPQPIALLRIRGARLHVPDSSRAATGMPNDAPAGAIPLGVLPALELEDVELTSASPVGPIRARLGSKVTQANGSLRMQLDGDLEGAGAGATLRVDARLEPGGTVSMTVDAPSLQLRGEAARFVSGSARARFDLKVRGLGLESGSGRIDLSLADVTVGDTTLGGVVAAMPVTFSHAREGWVTKLTDADLRISEPKLHLAGITGESSGASLELGVERFEDTGAERRFEPFRLHARRLGLGPDLAFSADFAVVSGRAALSAKGRYDAAAGIATLDFTLPRTEFDPNRRRPVDLSAELALLGAVKGSVEGTATVRWKRGAKLEARAGFALDEVSTVTERMTIDGMSGRATLGALSPPRTTGLQTLHIRRLHPGVEFQDVDLGWALEPVPDALGSRLRIEHLTAEFAGGRMLVGDTRLDPHAAANRMDFRFEDVDVARLFALAGLHGVGGTGRLAGSVPVTVQGGAVAIDDGELEANSGVLQIRSEEAAHLLASGGQSVELLLAALGDFHYDRLVVKIHKALAGEAAVAVRLEGSNPAVLDGYPFRINLNVSGNLDRLVGSLLEVASLSDRAVRATVHAIH